MAVNVRPFADCPKRGHGFSRLVGLKQAGMSAEHLYFLLSLVGMVAM